MRYCCLIKVILVFLVNLFFLTFTYAGSVEDGKVELQSDDNNLTKIEKIKLLELSRKTLQSVVREKIVPAFSADELGFSPKFGESNGVFVTLKSRGALRGCIGNIFPYQTLCDSVIRNTVNSAFYDNRFIPVTINELANIEIEISVLSKIREIPGYKGFEPGRHGVIINMDKASAVFLPQVAVEQNWNREETLSHLCVKAGLPKDAWKDSDMKFSVFTADVFNEEELVSVEADKTE